MKCKKRSITKWVVLFLVFLLFRGDISLAQKKDREEPLDKLFQWTKMDYLEGRYREVVTSLKQLLSYFGEENDPLKGKVHLLLGATYEKLGRIREARENYRLCSEILRTQKEKMEIEGIDFSYLEEYQRIIKRKEKPAQQGIIERPAVKPEKKRISPLLIIGAAVVVGVLALFLLKKKKEPPQGEGDAGFDTRVLGIEWIQVQEGSYVMGDTFNEGEADELPLRDVYVSTFYISKFEITFDQYDRFCDETGREKPSNQGWGRGDRPVIDVSRQDADAFCMWISGKTGKIIRLPTEAQWEKATKGTTTRRYPWGDSPPDCDKANYNCDNQTHPVGSHTAGVSYFNIHDLAGNVAEWCRDVYSPTFYSQTGSPVTNPVYSIEAYYDTTLIVVRGGSWDSSEDIGIRCADRAYRNYAAQSPTIGFRVVLELLD